jgi:uracil-DNA glycosylase
MNMLVRLPEEGIAGKRLLKRNHSTPGRQLETAGRGWAERASPRADYNREVSAAVSSELALALLNERIVACERCPRLRSHCMAVAEKKRRAYLQHDYWGRPVPSFGDPEARVLFVGLAPGAHGSNRTGRPFTGDGSGDFLYPLLHRAGFATQPTSTRRGDGLELQDAWITSVVRCAPPGNKPLPEEIARCSSFLDEEIAALAKVRAIVCLGKIAFDGVVAHLMRTGAIERRGELIFGHGVEYAIPGHAEEHEERKEHSGGRGRRSVAGDRNFTTANGDVPAQRWLLASYHPSLQNTNTGKLTAAMMLRVFARARQLADLTGR